MSAMDDLASDRQAAAAIRALTAQVVERDAVIEQVREWEDREDKYDANFYELDEILSQAPLDALAVRDNTVRATALEEAADYLETNDPFGDYRLIWGWLRDWAIDIREGQK